MESGVKRDGDETNVFVERHDTSDGERERVYVAPPLPERPFVCRHDTVAVKTRETPVHTPQATRHTL